MLAYDRMTHKRVANFHLQKGEKAYEKEGQTGRTANDRIRGRWKYIY